MTLSSRHRIRNSSPGGLRPSTLPLGHGGSPQYWLSHVGGEETFFVSFKPPSPGTEPRTLAWKAAVLTTTLGPPPVFTTTKYTHRCCSRQPPCEVRPDKLIMGLHRVASFMTSFLERWPSIQIFTVLYHNLMDKWSVVKLDNYHLLWNNILHQIVWEIIK